VAPATMRRHDRVVCFVVSLYRGYVNFCVKTVLLCEDYEFSLICIFLFRLLYTIFDVYPILEAPIRGDSQNKDYIKETIYSSVNRGTCDHIFLN
jgi:hypothetical protein